MISPVLWITERYPPAKGGMAASCARQVRALRKRGLRVDVLVPDGGGAEIEVTSRDGGADIRVRREREPGATANLAWTEIRERHLRQPYRVVVGFGASGAGFLATTFAAWLALPSVVLIRGNDFDRDWFTGKRGGWLREALTRASAVGAVTQEKADRVARMYPGKPVVWTPNGIDAGRWELLEADRARRDQMRGLLARDGRRVFGLFGELKFKKRIPLWLEAVGDAGLVGRISLLVVGTLDEPTARILEDPALAPPSVRLPFSPPDELAGLYHACDFVAIPSAFEGMPNVLLEAMACGTPVVASDAGAMGSVIEDGVSGFLFGAENRQAAGEATRRAVDLSPEEHAAMRNRAFEAVTQRFTIAREADVIEALLEQTVR